MWYSSQKESTGNNKSFAISPRKGRKGEPDNSPRSGCQGLRGGGCKGRRNSGKVRFSKEFSPIRQEKVEKAKRKKQKGDYNTQEVYRKIADRLMELFGIR